MSRETGASSSIGYQPLVAFELARLCTRLGTRWTHSSHPRYQSRRQWTAISTYSDPLMGQLPQGAPTSPRIANLAARGLDEALTNIAASYSLRYSRYADDMTFSTGERLDRGIIQPLIGAVYKAIATNGFSPNKAKTTISPPGARKLVLGLLVDRETPRLTREFKARLRQHLYYLHHAGPAAHAAHQGGATVFGVRRHVLGLIQHARQIERTYGDRRLTEFKMIAW